MNDKNKAILLVVAGLLLVFMLYSILSPVGNSDVVYNEDPMLDDQSNIEKVETEDMITKEESEIEELEVEEPKVEEPKVEEPKVEEPEVEEPKVEEPKIEEPKIPKEYESALKKAEVYGKKLHMSKSGIFKQLTSEYGEKFSEEAATYAIENVDIDYNENALQKAIVYQDQLSMAPDAIRDQLISEYGEGFTEAEADYAMKNLPK